MTPFTREIELEAAMCAWEHAQTNINWEHGAGQLRYCCGNLAEAIHIGYCAAGEPDDVAYDWEFVPWFLDNCVIWDTPQATVYGFPDLKLDWLQKCRELNQ